MTLVEHRVPAQGGSRPRNGRNGFVSADADGDCCHAFNEPRHWCACDGNHARAVARIAVRAIAADVVAAGGFSGGAAGVCPARVDGGCGVVGRFFKSAGGRGEACTIGRQPQRPPREETTSRSAESDRNQSVGSAPGSIGWRFSDSPDTRVNSTAEHRSAEGAHYLPRRGVTSRRSNRCASGSAHRGTRQTGAESSGFRRAPFRVHNRDRGSRRSATTDSRVAAALSTARIDAFARKASTHTTEDSQGCCGSSRFSVNGLPAV